MRSGLNCVYLLKRARVSLPICVVGRPSRRRLPRCLRAIVIAERSCRLLPYTNVLAPSLNFPPNSHTALYHSCRDENQHPHGPCPPSYATVAGHVSGRHIRQWPDARLTNFLQWECYIRHGEFRNESSINGYRDLQVAR